MKQDIINLLNKHKFSPVETWLTCDVICDEDFDNIAEEIVKLLAIHIISQGTELLPDFLYKNKFGQIRTGYHGDEDCHEEYIAWLKKLGNCG